MTALNPSTADRAHAPGGVLQSTARDLLNQAQRHLDDAAGKLTRVPDLTYSDLRDVYGCLDLAWLVLHQDMDDDEALCAPDSWTKLDQRRAALYDQWHATVRSEIGRRAVLRHAAAMSGRTLTLDGSWCEPTTLWLTSASSLTPVGELVTLAFSLGHGTLDSQRRYDRDQLAYVPGWVTEANVVSFLLRPHERYRRDCWTLDPEVAATAAALWDPHGPALSPLRNVDAAVLAAKAICRTHER